MAAKAEPCRKPTQQQECRKGGCLLRPQGATRPRITCSSRLPTRFVGVEDAILYLLHRAHSHLDKGSGTVRILFLDFSSAFNTIQPTMLRDKLSRMGVDPQLMDWISDYLTRQTTMFYQSVVASVLFYTVVCWGGSISKKDTSRLDKLIRRAGSVVGMKLDSLVTVAESRTLDKLLDIMDNASHPLHTVISNQRSLFSERLLLPSQV
ncbi:hypothetical protein L3Q82_018410 [Scortum barcoo]|uniref:Uncharacterized protein n=1 Tax=Scortum barcoo TaxID=214431 RepID=A0ACB8VJ80_9TELE|nr:hypothetical protein L3Q82_018410 [Scortum barcoo]